MKTKLLGSAVALGLAAAPLASFADVNTGNSASTWTIYGWQNYSYEFVNTDGEGAADAQSTQRINANAANIGFSASIDTGLSLGGQAIKANLQCEQFTFHNRNNGTSDFCNRNSKIGLSGAFGEIMFGQWLLPYNEMVAQWVDPFYDAGADSHTSIMGNIGGPQAFFYNGGFTGGGTAGGAGTGFASQAFNRRQEEIVQYFSPNINGFTFRIATTNATPGESFGPGGGDVTVTTFDGSSSELDPRIWSTGLAYETTLSNGNNVWLAATYESHDEWAAQEFGCEDSDDESWRIAGRYIHQWDNGMSTRISAMYENLEYDHEGCAAPDSDGMNTGTTIANSNIADGSGDLDVERDAWMISGVQSFGNGFDFRFSYMDADELDCDTGCTTDDDTDAVAWNVGIFYTMPAGTELRLTYSEVDNEDNSAYDYGIGGVGIGVGEDTDFVGLGIVQWF